MSKIKVMACSGIGKVFGLMAREAALEVTDHLCPDTTERICLANIVSGEAPVKKRIEGCPCITIDGCAAMCSEKSVENAGGIVKAKYRAIDTMRSHRGVNAGDGTSLTQEGWKITDEFAKNISAKVAELVEEEKNNG